MLHITTLQTLITALIPGRAKCNGGREETATNGVRWKASCAGTVGCAAALIETDTHPQQETLTPPGGNALTRACKMQTHKDTHTYLQGAHEKHVYAHTHTETHSHKEKRR